jgi:hypothetical protein
MWVGDLMLMKVYCVARPAYCDYYDLAFLLYIEDLRYINIMLSTALLLLFHNEPS